MYQLGECHLATYAPYTSETIDRLCIVAAPIAIYIRHPQKQAFRDALQLLMPNRVLPLSARQNRFLQTNQRRTVNINVIVEALAIANIAYVTLYAYAMKSPLRNYIWMDLPMPRPRIVLDIGFTVQQGPDETVPVYLPKATDVHFEDGEIVVFPMFSHLSRFGSHNNPYGSIVWTNPDNEFVTKIKVYPCWVHLMKAYGGTNMTSLPTHKRTCANRITQITKFLEVMNWDTSTDYYKPFLNKGRIELTVQHTMATLQDTVNRANHLMQEFTNDFLEIKNIPVNTIKDNISDWINVTKLYKVGKGRHTTELTQGEIQIMAVLLNQAGICTDTVKRNLTTQSQVTGRYPFHAVLHQRFRPRLPRQLPRSPPTSPPQRTDAGILLSSIMLNQL